MSVREAISITLRPVETPPVNETMPTSGCAARASPLGVPPVITLRIPGGSSSAASWPNSIVLSGVSGEGFSTTVLPAIRAGAIRQAAIPIG